MPYHLSPSDGNARPCSAKTSCPYGDLTNDHYTTPESARQAYEAKQEAFPAPLDPKTFAKSMEEKYPGIEVSLNFSHGGYAVLHGVRVPKGQQCQGVGTAFMKDLIEQADSSGWALALTPSTDWGASSKTRLERFYRRFDFVPNKGRNKDFTTMESMLRPAAKSGS